MCWTEQIYTDSLLFSKPAVSQKWKLCPDAAAKRMEIKSHDILAI